MIASGHSEASGLERFAVVFLVMGTALCVVGILHIIFGLIFLWITAIIGVILFVIGGIMLVIGVIQYHRAKGRLKQACAEAQQTTPAVVGYNPFNYGTQGQTLTKGHYPQVQSGHEGQPGIPPKQNYPVEPDAPPSYDEVDKH